ncbi:hypothetical protein EV421DRAFT_1914383 [Armillaria borealis]|uniref:Uncharacterized protein n=1 Tax=Armillaria borealis TaxID=47425 RepID=A0AA39ITU2_9AGAR|nr:hypothetical protein EV421DRAFT_1914383 [Armillaria borealis]
MPSSTSPSSTDSNTTDAGLTPAPISTLFISPHAFDSSGNATESIPFSLTPLSPPSISSAPSTTQLHTTQTQGYSLDDYFVQYPEHLINSSYARQPDSGVTDGSFEYQYYLPNAMHRGA